MQASSRGGAKRPAPLPGAPPQAASKGGAKRPAPASLSGQGEGGAEKKHKRSDPPPEQRPRPEGQQQPRLQQLQERVDRALSSGGGGSGGAARAAESSDATATTGTAAAALNLLARDLAAAGETGALVRVWDRLGGGARAEDATWRSVEVRRHAPTIHTSLIDSTT